jgi:hypothetical protein
MRFALIPYNGQMYMCVPDCMNLEIHYLLKQG